MSNNAKWYMSQQSKKPLETNIITWKETLTNHYVTRLVVESDLPVDTDVTIVFRLTKPNGTYEQASLTIASGSNLKMQVFLGNQYTDVMYQSHYPEKSNTQIYAIAH